MRFRKIKGTVSLTAAALLLAGCASTSTGGNEEEAASNFPEHPITLVVAWDAGGGTDIIARAYAQSAEEHLGQKINVVNKPGGSGAVGWGEIAHSTEPDGYTLTLVSGEIGYLREVDGLYDFGAEHFDLITMINQDSPALAVRADAPWDTLDDFLTDAGSSTFSVGTAGPGLVWDMAAKGLGEQADVTFTHVPFDGAAGAVQAVLGGSIEAMTFSLGEVASQVKAGEMKVLAVGLPERDPNFPDVPTFDELGYDVVSGFRGIAGPAGMDPEIIATLDEAFVAMAEDSRYTDVMEENSLGIRVLETEQFQEYFDTTTAAYRELAGG